MAEQPDQEVLAQRFAEGDQGVLESILRAYGPAIAGWLGQKYDQLNREEIRDILSTALWKLWEARDRYNSAKSTIRSFYFLLARHEAIDTLRSAWHCSSRHEVPLGDRADSSEGTEMPAAANADPGHNDEPSKIIRDLNRCMEDLNESSRRVLWADACSSAGGVPSGVLAQEFNLSESAIRQARKRGLDKLREAMKKLGY